MQGARLQARRLRPGDRPVSTGERRPRRLRAAAEGALRERAARAPARTSSGSSSVMQVPRVEKITLNMGVGEAKTDAKALDAAIEELTTIAGQRAQMRRARKSIASFKLREGMPIGARVTLRGARMYEFLDRLVSIALPRIRDFRGLEPGLVRRARQLLARHPRADHLPGDRLRRRSPRSAASTSRSRPPRQTDEQARALLRGSACRSRDDRRESAVDGQEVADRQGSRARSGTRCARTRAATAAAARARSSASSASAGSACGSSRTRA